MENLTKLDQMRQRLAQSLEERKVSWRAASLAAKCSPGYLHSVIKDGKEPTVAKLAQICTTNDIDLSYVLFGFEISEPTKKLIAAIEESPDKRDAILRLIDGLD